MVKTPNKQVALYQEEGGDWRWKMTHQNGRVIAASTEGYRNYEEMINNLSDVLDLFGEHRLERKALQAEQCHAVRRTDTLVITLIAGPEEK